MHLTGNLSHDNGVEGVPFADYIARINLGTVVEEQFGTVDDRRGHKGQTGVGVEDAHFCQTSHHYLVTVFGIDGTELVDFETTVVA